VKLTTEYWVGTDLQLHTPAALSTMKEPPQHIQRTSRAAVGVMKGRTSPLWSIHLFTTYFNSHIIVGIDI
jgi:hypothetical protein